MNFDVKKFSPSFYKEVLYEKGSRHCRMCPAILPSWVKYYCNHHCIELAMVDGSYGKEDETMGDVT